MAKVRLLCLIMGLCANGFCQSNVEIIDTDVRKIQEALRKNPPPAFKEIVARRLEERRALQRRGYAGMLYESVHEDALSALISCFTTNVQMSFSLSDGFLFWVIPPDPIFNTPGIAFEEDMTFPADPWDER